MKEIIIVKPERCIGCGACIRGCPAPESNLTRKLENGKLVTSVDPSKCIGCGECIRNCRRGARDYIDDTEQFMDSLGRQETILIVDPALKAAFPLQWTGILDWFRKYNCIVFDGALGADIYVWCFLSLMESGRMRNMISTSCPAVTNYIKIYRPSLMKKLAPIFSPAACCALYIKNYLKKEHKIAVLTPCTAKKMECMETGLIDYSITFKKLTEYFSRNGVAIPNDQPDNYDYPFADVQGQLGALLSRTGGLKDNILARKSEAYIESSQGADTCCGDLAEYEQMPEIKLPDALDILMCGHGCVMSTGSSSTQNYFEVMANMRSMEAEAREKLKGRGRFRNTDARLFKKFDDELDIESFLRVFRPLKPPPAPTEEDLSKGFALLEKKNGVERTYNCGSCGYSTCREMAAALFKGKNCPESCAEYRKKHSQPLTAEEKKYEDILKECEAVAKKLDNRILSMSGDLKDIADASGKAAEKAKNVNDLMNSIVTFCNKNATMNEKSVQQMTKILQTTIRSLITVEDNINKASIDSSSVSDSVSGLDELIAELKGILDNSSTKTEAAG